MKKLRRILSLLLGLCVVAGLGLYTLQNLRSSSDFLSRIPPYDGQVSIALSENEPDFPDQDKTTQSFERYSPLDLRGRCGAAYANVGRETMPTGERESIFQVKPSGWQTARYDFVDGQSLYNRCHLIGWMLTGENANEQNLITGTRYFNVQGMLPYELRVADYVRETGNHVLYRVTPHYGPGELVARGVEMEALSVEDAGAGIRFHVYIYNVQPGVGIDYATGESWLVEAPNSGGSNGEGQESSREENPGNSDADYVLNISSRKFHLPPCSGAKDISDNNRREYTGSREELLAQGYTPCGSCKP